MNAAYIPNLLTAFVAMSGICSVASAALYSHHYPYSYLYLPIPLAYLYLLIPLAYLYFKCNKTGSVELSSFSTHGVKTLIG
jgi:hypothetical protein